MSEVPDLCNSIDSVTQQVEDEGAGKFVKPFDKLMESGAKVGAALDEASMKVSPYAGNPAEAGMPVKVPRVAIIHNTDVPGWG